MQRLDLSACRRAQDWELRSLTGLRELGALRLDGLDALTDGGVALLVPLAAQLTAFSLRNCSKVRRQAPLLGDPVMHPRSPRDGLGLLFEGLTQSFCAAGSWCWSCIEKASRVSSVLMLLCVICPR